MARAATYQLLPAALPAERVAACIGVLSDTHMPDRCAALPPALFDLLRGVDLVLHAGDVGELWVLDRLSAIAPVIAVHGNDETMQAQRELPYQQIISVAGCRIVLSHCHYPDRAEELESRRDDAWEPKLDRRAAFGTRAGANIVVFGHTHIPMMLEHNGVLLVNPGAIASGGSTSRQRRQTLVLLFIRDDGVPAVVHIDLANPDQPFVPQIRWESGFRAALDQYSESILSAELAQSWPQFKALARSLAPQQTYAALLRVAHRCWAGEQQQITSADLRAELRVAADLPAATLAQLESLMLDA